MAAAGVQVGSELPDLKTYHKRYPSCYIASDLGPGVRVYGQPRPVDEEARPLGAWLPVVLRVQAARHLLRLGLWR